MGDFLTRLAERTLGTAPVVQPLMPSTFAPEPTGYAPDSGWDGDAPAPSDASDRPRAPGAPGARQEDRSSVAPATPKHPRGTLDTRRESRDPAAPAPAERRLVSTREDQGNPPPVPPGHPRRTPAGPDPRHSTEPGPARRDEAAPASPDLPPGGFLPVPLQAEGGPGRAASRFTGASVERGRGVSSPEPGPSADVQEDAPEPGARSRVPPAAGAASKDMPTGRPEYAATVQREDRQEPPSATSEHARRTPGIGATPRRPVEVRPLERRDMSGQEDQRGSPRSTMRHPPTPPGTNPEALRRADRGPARRGVSSTPQLALPESLPFKPSSTAAESGRSVFRPIETLVAPPSDDGGVPGSEATLDRSATPDAPRPVAPRTDRPRSNSQPERGSREPSAAPAPELPTIRVSIGRIEVRAIAPPVQRPAPARRPGPALALDDYLKQRSGGQR